MRIINNPKGEVIKVLTTVIIFVVFMTALMKLGDYITQEIKGTKGTPPTCQCE